MAFLEEQLAEEAQLNSSYADAFEVDVVETMVNRYSVLKSPYILSKFSLLFNNRDMAAQLSEVVNLFHRSGGQFGGFRFKHPAEYTTNNYVDAPTVSDSVCEYLTAITYQLAMYYGVISTTCPRRRIKKPVSATTLVGIRDSAGANHQMVSSNWAVDITTGIITLDADYAPAITAISKATQAVINIGGSHSMTTNDSVVIEGVAGMTEINDLRGNIVAINTGLGTITVDINSSAFSTYTSVGTAARNPSLAAGEALSCGCEFDIPVAFDMDISNITFSEYDILSLGIPLIEIRNPIA